MSENGRAAPPRPTPLATIFDVARVAGVGKTTVSDAIQGRGRMTPETRARVLAAVEQLGYHAHIGARNLIRRRTEDVGVVAGDLFDPFSAELIAHVEQAAAKRGFRILLTTAGTGADAGGAAIASLMEHRVAAIVVISFTGDEQVLAAAAAHTPIVHIGSKGAYGASVAIDDRRTAAIATEHLVQLGHRRIAYLCSSGVPRETDRDCRSGYRDALRRAGIVDDRRLVVRVPADSERRRYARMRELLSGPDRPTAAFGVSDITAIELVSCAGEVGLRVPEDLSVVGFDDIALARMPMIALTTVAQPIGELARRGVEAAIALIEDPETPPRVPQIEPALIVRRTTAPPRAGA